MVEIHLTRGYTAFVDDADADLANLKWFAQPHGRTAYGLRHIPRSGGGRAIERLHRAVWRRAHPGKPIPAQLDHVDGNGLNCTRTNLRAASREENGRNQRLIVTNRSGFKGVSWHQDRSKWHARIKFAGKRKHIGLFVNKYDAARAYDAAAREVFGAFARLNFPMSGENSAAL
jgi:hypothetical protein